MSYCRRVLHLPWSTCCLHRSVYSQFQSFQLEQPYSGKCMDWLTVSNSTSPTERLCGTADVNQLRHMDYVTTGNALIIQFVTDSKISGNGFQAVYATDIAKSKTNKKWLKY